MSFAGPALVVLLTALASCKDAREQATEAAERKARAETAGEDDNVPELTNLELDVASDPPIRGSAPAFAECRELEQPGAVKVYQVATTKAQFTEGGPAALGLMIDGYRGPGSYTTGVTVTISKGTSGSQTDILAARDDCVASVADAKRGSFSCEHLRPPLGVDSVGVTGRGSWLCWH